MPSLTAVTQAGSGRFDAGHLDQAQPAGAHVGQPVEMAQRRDVDAVLAGHVEDRLAVAPATSMPSMRSV